MMYNCNYTLFLTMVSKFSVIPVVEIHKGIPVPLCCRWCDELYFCSPKHYGNISWKQIISHNTRAKHTHLSRFNCWGWHVHTQGAELLPHHANRSAFQLFRVPPGWAVDASICADWAAQLFCRFPPVTASSAVASIVLSLPQFLESM